MIVDCHTHVDFSPEAISENDHLEAANTVDKCIVLAKSFSDSDLINKKVAQYVAKHSDKMVAFAKVNPIKDRTGLKKLDYLYSDLAMKGIVLFCGIDGFHPAHSAAMNLYDAAQQMNMPVFFDNGDLSRSQAFLEFAQPYLIDEIARNFPDLKIIIGSMGIPFHEQTLLMVAKHKNVYADLTFNCSNSWQIYNIVVAAYERKVMDKLLFGSGFPLGKPGQSMEVLLGINKLFGDTKLPTVPRGEIENLIQRDTLELLSINHPD